ncbi:hemagglutinin [Vibrio phage 2E1]|nr:hemagglutinin [Vibrio phage 2E1]
MTIPKITPYSGGVANPDGSQTQTEFTQNMFDQLSYEAELSTELNNTVDGINDTATQVDADATSAAQSASAAEAAVSGLDYKGLWPDTGGIADKGDTYQTQVGGTPTGQYFTALQNTTVDPVGDDVNWREVVSAESLSQYTDIVFKASGGNSAVDNMIAGVPFSARVGDCISTGSGSWKKIANNGNIDDFIPLNGVWVDDFGADPSGGGNSTLSCQGAIDVGGSIKFGAGVYVVDEIVSSSVKGVKVSGVASSVYLGASNQLTTIKARTADQVSIFKYDGGTTCQISNIAFDGDGKALRNINCESPSLILDNVTSYRSKEYGIWAKALTRFKNVFVRDNQQIGCSISSDGAITDSEFTGGTVPLQLRAGGNTLTGCWINTGSDKCLWINIGDGTSNINTRVLNCYIGEVLSEAVSKPAVHIEGTNSQRIRHVMFSGCHFVHAATTDLAKNGMIRIEYGKGVAISGCTFRGLGPFGTTARHTDYGIYASDCSGLVVSGNYFETVNRNIIRLDGLTTFEVVGNTFRECGEQFGTAQDRAMLRVDTSTISGVMIANSMQNPDSSEPYLAHGGSASLIYITDNLIRGGQAALEWEGLSGYNQGRNLRAGQLGPTQRSLSMTAESEVFIQNNTLFVDSADDLLKYRDNSGNLRVVNIT